MNEIMRDEIFDQPEALARSLPDLRLQTRELAAGLKGRRRIFFSGSGDSYFAGLAVAAAARRQLDLAVQVAPSFEASRYWSFGPGDILVTTSVSGQVRKTIEAAEAVRRAGGFAIAITANAASPLGQATDAQIVLKVKSRSRSTPHTTDYLTSLLANATLIEALSGRSIAALDSLSDLVGSALPGLEQSVLALAPALAAKEHLFFLGAGPSFATISYGAAKFHEAGGIQAIAFELDEFAHGPHLLVGTHDPVFVTAPTGASVDRAVEIAHGVREVGADVVAVTAALERFSGLPSLTIPTIEEEWSPFVTALPYQLLCWAVATAKGYDVVRKDGRIANPELYGQIHFRWARG